MSAAAIKAIVDLFAILPSQIRRDRVSMVGCAPGVHRLPFPPLNKARAMVLSADDMTACFQLHDFILGWTGKEIKQWLGHAVPEAINGRNNI